MTNRFRLEVGAEPLPGYRLHRFRGRGGFGEVWEAQNPKGDPVALKFLPCAKDGRASLETRAVQAVQRFPHPHLVRIDEICCAAGYLVIAMELADGSLQELLEAYQEEFRTPIPLDCLGPLMAQAAKALDFLNGPRHRKGDQRVGLQHCDVKPSNLLLFGDTLKLSDFSLMSTTHSASRRHRRAGTPEFAAPEVHRGRLSDRSDQYSLAVSYCLLRGGRLPFGQNPLFTAQTHSAPDLTMLPASERSAVGRALAPSPIDRWPTASAFVDRLWKDDSEVDAVATPERRLTIRFPCDRQATWRLLGEKQLAETVRIRDVSASGIGLIQQHEAASGTLVALDVGLGSESSTRSIYARVARSVRQPDGAWLIGCNFVRKLENGEMDALRSTEPECASVPEARGT